MLLQEGQIIRETYEVERFLGEGAFAEVYRVKHRFLGRQAMKVFKTVGMTLAETEQMLCEAIILSRIGHPNIIRVFDANAAETDLGECGFFTMEYVAGGSLDQFWRSYGTNLIPIETTVDIICQVCQGLTVAHSETPPIVHRDIKPQNILVGYDATGLRVRISDFGLARRVNPLTLLASARGTRCFKAPEVFRDPYCDSCAGDVWAIGSTLYLLLTDRLPYITLEDSDLIDLASFDQPLIAPGRLNFQVDPFLEDIVLRSLAVNPKDRYPNAAEMLADLNKWRQAPAKAVVKNQRFPSETEKSALGAHSPADEDGARKMAARAIELSQHAGKLPEAADQLEEAFNKWPELRDEYEYKLQLWRRGIAM